MTLWMSRPSIMVPEAGEPELLSEVDPVYERICRAFSCPTGVTQDGLRLPRAYQLDREELAASALRALLRGRCRNGFPDILIDCCSSPEVGGPAPTYKLAARSGLAKVLPVAIDGQAGAEAAHALLFLRHMSREMPKGAVLSAVQRFAPPDPRAHRDGFPLADGAAAVDCSVNPLPNSFRVLGVAVGQLVGEWRSLLDSLLKRAEEEAHVSEAAIEWSVAHRCCTSFLLAAEQALPHARPMVRDLHPECDFGCADTLISLARLCTTSSVALTGIGVLWFVGRFGSVGSVLVHYQRGSDNAPED